MDAPLPLDTKQILYYTKSVMQMNNVIDKLVALQDVLSEKYRLEELIDSSPKQMQAQDELLSRLKKEFIDSSAQYDEIRNHTLTLKGELSESENAREHGEKGMDSITTHREYEALDKEIREATEKEQFLRKELQREEKQLADLNESLQQKQKLIEIQENELNVEKSNLQTDIDKYNTQLSDLKTQEETIAGEINDKEIIFKFERIIKSNKQSSGIVAVKGKVCDGCHMILPAQFANRVRANETIEFCPYCSRILYYQELGDADGAEYFHVEDTGNLVDFDNDFDEENIDEDDSESWSGREEPADIDFD
ncbi:MAG: C4-type zinc ribbon domain-containing protein [Treponemataceae bacterium]|nr:MAG: C4-type zinc ribbon domain-containing protein [Treponemataceae bacterium]